jgi:hypoxanthine phosphoribosyltransferase
MKEKLKMLFSEKEIDDMVSDIAARIERDIEGDEVVMIGVLKGAFIFLADLVRKINKQVIIDFVVLSSYQDAMQSSGVVKMLKDISVNIKGKDVIIVEDIIDTGLTMDFLVSHLEKKNPKSVSICALLYKSSKVKLKTPVRYIGKEIEDLFVVGYGLDYAERYRNLSYIGYIELLDEKEG